MEKAERVRERRGRQHVPLGGVLALRFARGDLRGGVPILWSAAEDVKCVGLLAKGVGRIFTKKYKSGT